MNIVTSRLTSLLLVMTGCLVCITSITDGVNPRVTGVRWSPVSGSLLTSTDDGRNHNNSSACTPRSVETFPPDLFTLQQKQRGAIIIHVLVVAWLFAALAILSHDYFVASLEVVCYSLHMKPDVAGATFMAAGNSAAELLASVIGVFLAQSDVGVSTIVGSAIFNNLMIVSLCGLAASQAVLLSMWPLVRDCGFYCLSVAALIAVIHDGLITWYESLVQLTLFGTYIVVMVFNGRIDSAFTKRFPRFGTSGGTPKLCEEKEPTADDKNILLQTIEVWTVDTANQMVHNKEIGGPVSVEEVEVVENGPQSPFTMPHGLLKRIYWVLMLPWLAAFRFTIPDCRRPGIWKRLFILTFLVSVIWISGLIYMLVWMVCATGDAMGIPDTVMGLTLLAIGTCIPDAMAGIFVSKSGLGDMAIANAIASNVFDITACLGLPWFLSTAVIKPGSTVVINSSGLTYTSITLLSTVIFLLVALYLNKLQMDKKLGVIFLIVYLVVSTFACLYESNVLGPLNPLPCPRTRL